MSSINSGGAAIDASPSAQALGILSRRGSRASISSQVDKEQLSQALDKIHTSASQSDTLTTFNEFSSPPSASAAVETKGLADELMQNGISGLYNRFRGAVVGGKEKTNSGLVKEDSEGGDTSPLKSQPSSITQSNKGVNSVSSKGNIASSASPLMQSAPISRLQSPTASSFAIQSSSSPEPSQQALKSSAISKHSSSSRGQITPLTKSIPSAIIVPTVAPVTVTAFRENDGAQKGPGVSDSDNNINVDVAMKKSPFPTRVESPRDVRRSNRSDINESPLTPTFSNLQELFHIDTRIASRSNDDQPVGSEEQDGTVWQSISGTSKGVNKDTKDRPDLRVDLPRVPEPITNGDGSGDLKVNDLIALSMTQPSNSPRQMSDLSSPTTTIHTRMPPALRRSTAIERLTQSHLPGYRPSRASSTDRSTAEFSPITTSAHNSVRHESFSMDDDHGAMLLGNRRIPGTTTSGDPQAVSNRLEQMRKQVSSKEYWMKDDICKECFLCGNSFSAFRRKHHCRTCGCIFDSKCTSIISGDRFGVQGSLRVCKTCLDIINRRHESSGSDNSADDAPLSTCVFPTPSLGLGEDDSRVRPNEDVVNSGEWDNTQQFVTPMMAIPATRRTGDSSSRKSAVLEIDAPQLPRPNSSRSLKSLPGRPSSGHRRMHSKHNLLGRFKSVSESRAPFRRDAIEEMGKRSKLPAFHDDNIIDPDLEPYMSDDGSSGDEQISIFAAMNGGGGGVPSSSLETDRSQFGSLLTTGKRHRVRPDKSVSGISFTSRNIDDGHSRSSRRRNLSTSTVIHHTRGSPRSNKIGGLMKGIGSLGEELMTSRESVCVPSSSAGRMTRSASMRDAKYPPIELNPAMLHHAKMMLRQLLHKENVPNARLWEKALLPILLRCVDDVDPNIRRGDEIDIRHYVKLKKVPGGRPRDTSYVSGVVFTKKLALKSMPRSIPHPRIVVVSFSIEYSRHRDNFMSLEPVIAQEQEFLRNMVNRIASLRPSLLLVQKNVSGLALQYLAEANIAVISNVKQSVIEAVSRCTETLIVSSIDMVTLRPVHVGKSASFDVKTYVNKDIPGRKKTLIYISGCAKELGCTIVLRGANMRVLAKMKRVSEFMVHVVYNLKLETSLMRDQFISIPSIADESGSLSPSKQQVPQAPPPGSLQDDLAEASDEPSESREPGASMEPGGALGGEVETSDQSRPDKPRLISAHESHLSGSHESHEDQLPEDVPMPTFYSDLVAEHQTKILSASPFVKFMQPYLLERVRQQERRLMYLKRLRDQDTFEEQTEDEKTEQQPFQLIKPEMVHETVKGAPKQIMEVLHAVHDAEYDKALHNYQTHQRQWENSIQGNVDLFDPYWHQNIVVLYTLVCTATTVPCAGPEVLALEFYNEHLREATFDPDCTLGQYIEDLCMSADTVCTFNGCDRKLAEHHRTYVHGEARITVFLEKMPASLKGMPDSILMWSYCKICKKETQMMPMSDDTWKYSFGKYLELSFWSSGLHLQAEFCPHDFHRDHIRFFGFKNVAVRIHYDPIDLLEIVVPRARITWKVDNDLRLKNDLFTKTEDRWNRFMMSVKSRIKGINIDSVIPEKSAACKAEVDKMAKRANDEHESMIRKLQEKYMESKYYEIIPMNRAVRAMQEKVAEWDATFADFDNNFFPSEKDIRRLAALQLKKMFMDRDESTPSLVSTDPGDIQSDLDERSTTASIELNPNPSDMSPEDADNMLSSVLDGNVVSSEKSQEASVAASPIQSDGKVGVELEQSGIQPLDLALSHTSTSSPTELEESTELCETPQPISSLDSSQPPTPSETTSIASSSEASDTTIKPNAFSTIDMCNLEVALVPAAPPLTGIPRPTDRKVSRRSGTTLSPTVSRTQSQPVGSLRRVHTPAGLMQRNELPSPATHGDALDLSHDNSRSPVQDSPKGSEKKLTERFGLKLKTHRKVGPSLIPRSVQNRRTDSKVSALAKHFDQLSREFEKERLRDRKQRAATVTQSRAFPRASSKPIVEVYRNVTDAVEERGPSDDDVQAESMQTNDEIAAYADVGTNLNQESTDDFTRPPSPSGTIITAETATETDDQQLAASQTHSDEECNASDAETSLLDDLPGAADIAASLDDHEAIAGAEINLELPKHEKTSVMKMLTNFWAERSASGWTQLEYLLNASDHIFIDSDIIVREDEPSSLIAFALSSDDYKAKLQSIRRQGRDDDIPASPTEHEKISLLDPCQDDIDQAEVEQSLLRATGTHLKYQFAEGTAKMLCKIFYAEQFDAVRRKCGVADRIVESLSRCLKWDSKGGKTKSVFLKTLDDRFILKSLSPVETQAFLRFAPAYFNIMAEALFHELPTVIAKMLGFFQIVIRNPVTGTEIKWDVLIMENLFYDRSPTRIFDLKGSMRNRKIQSTGEQNEVLLDENMVEFIYESPLFAREHSKKLLRASVWNDTLFLARQNVMDYSLMVAVDEARKELVVGIIDCIRTYTWDKKLESWIKDKGFVGGGRNKPTVTSPKEYKSRFREAMARYVLQAPSCWHQFKHEPIGLANTRKPSARETDTIEEMGDMDRYDN